MRDWTVAVAQHSTFACSSTLYLRIWLYNNVNMFTYLTMIFNYSILENFLVSSVRVGGQMRTRIATVVNYHPRVLRL
jgi:hypothetical protein